MKKRFFLFSLLLLTLVSCSKKSGADHYEGDKVMKWTDEYFIQICSQVFNKPADHITYKDVSAIEKIMYVVINGEEKISVFLSNNPEAKLINRPNSTIKSIEDLIYFKNLQYFEIFEENILGIEVLQDMPQLKTLVLRGRVNIKMIKKIAKYSHLESLTMPYFNIDYSCLTQLSTLKNLVITTPFNGVTRSLLCGGIHCYLCLI